MSESRVITLEEIRARAMGEVVEIPDWHGSGTIRVRLRRIDLTPHLLRAGIVPNRLKLHVQQLFAGPGAVEAAGDDLQFDLERVVPVLDAIAREALVEPSYEDVVQILPLTLQQKIAILRYVTGELEALESFRAQG